MTNKNNKRRSPNGVAFVTLNEKYNGFRILILVRNCKSLSAFGSSAGQNLAAVGSRHSLSETVLVSTFSVRRLISALHLSIVFILLLFR